MNKLTTWERIELIRNKERPTLRDYIPLVFEEFIELHGDRYYGDGGAIIGGIATLGGTPVTVVGQLKGKTIEENKRANFAMAHPEGYRKALRLMRQAEKFHRPIICFIDTPGAFCGIEAEERGQGEAIAKNLFEMMGLKTPVVSIVLGEGGSGGALGLGVCDRLAMLENAVYSVISPRGCASILWKDASREKEAAQVLRMTAEDLKEFGVCDDILAEPMGGAHKQPKLMAHTIRDYLLTTVGALQETSVEELLENRYHKFRKIGEFSEE